MKAKLALSMVATFASTYFAQLSMAATSASTYFAQALTRERRRVQRTELHVLHAAACARNVMRMERARVRYSIQPSAARNTINNVLRTIARGIRSKPAIARVVEGLPVARAGEGVTIRGR